MAKTGAQRDKIVRAIRRTLGIFHEPGDVVEVRVLGIPGTRGFKNSAAGYFDDFDAAAREAARYDVESKPDAVYFVLNKLDPALMARSPNQITERLNDTTADRNILRRRWLLFDLDPDRPKGISSTQDELDAAGLVAVRVLDWLDSQGWPEPIQAMSGNGHHLLYPLNLPNDDEAQGLVKQALQTLDHQRGEWDLPDMPTVKVDLKVHNAARITKLYGTMARKGHDTTDRPHRRSELVYVPDYLNR